MLANSIVRQLIPGTVIPFHIHNVVAQLHQNGELRSAEFFDVVLMGQVLPHASPVLSQKTVFFFYIFGELSSVNLMDSSSISRISSSVPEFSA